MSEPKPTSNPHTVWAHTIITCVAIVSAYGAMMHDRIPATWFVGVLALTAGWVTPQVLVQAFTAYQRAVLSPPPASSSPSTPPMPPPGTLGLIALLGSLAGYHHG